MIQHHRTAEISVEESEEQTESYYKNESADTLQTETDSYYKSGTSSNSTEEGFTNTTAYGTVEVEANVFYYRKSISFNVSLSYKAVDVETGTILKSDTVNIITEDLSEWATWNGDEEALTDKDKLMIDTYEESVMSALQIATKAAEDAGATIAAGLASFLK
jgi:hypothetical protein